MSTTLRNFCVYILSACLSPFIAFLFRSCCVIYCLPISPLFLAARRGSMMLAHGERAQKGKNIIGPLTGPSKVWNWNMGHFEALSCTSCLAAIMRCCQTLLFKSCYERSFVEWKILIAYIKTVVIVSHILMCINFSRKLLWREVELSIIL